jgi:hypothetical protein
MSGNYNEIFTEEVWAGALTSAGGFSGCGAILKEELQAD